MSLGLTDISITFTFCCPWTPYPQRSLKISILTLQGTRKDLARQDPASPISNTEVKYVQMLYRGGSPSWLSSFVEPKEIRHMISIEGNES